VAKCDPLMVDSSQAALDIQMPVMNGFESTEKIRREVGLDRMPR